MICNSMALVKGWPRTGSAPLCTNNPALPPGLMCFHSTSKMKLSYSRRVRRTPVGIPVETITPSRTDQVPGAQLTLVQPAKSRPLNKGFHSCEKREVATRRKTRAERCIRSLWRKQEELNSRFSRQKTDYI